MSTPALAPKKLPLILLVEDSETAAAIVSRYLRDDYEVLCAADGAQAWDILSLNPDVELVLADVQMPRLNGHELLSKIRASHLAQIRNTPVILMTAAENNADRQRAFVNGANDFVLKPLDPLELQARVRVHQTLAHTIRELRASRRLLEEQAATDSLTRLKNRRAFADIGLRYFALARRHHHDLSVVMLDIDHFKAINDTYGHPAGDRVLVNIAQILASNIRTGDTPARMGGEEFAVLLPNTTRAGATLLAERIRLAVERERCPVAGRPVAVTASAGVASYGVDEPESLEQLVQVADKRLYLAKRSGRNCTVVDNHAGPF